MENIRSNYKKMYTGNQIMKILQREGKFDLINKLIFNEKKIGAVILEKEEEEIKWETKEVMSRWKEYMETLYNWHNGQKEEEMEVKKKTCENITKIMRFQKVKQIN